VLEGLIETFVAAADRRESRFYGVAIGKVIDNVDITGGGRVQVHLPWMPSFDVWARVAVLSAGSGCGTYFIPQVDDEVLLAFNHGDVRDAYIVGSLWNQTDSPPADLPNDPVNKRLIVTPAGHEIALDDLEQSVTVTTSTNQKITLDQQKIELEAAGGKVTIQTAGTITIQANTRLELKAPTISIEGQTIDVKASAAATLDGGGACTVKGGLVQIN
jgi:uncharacterized protein involved in type VI secretion and phage assembly